MNRLLAIAFLFAVLVFASANDAEAGCRNGYCRRFAPLRNVARATFRVGTAPVRLLPRLRFAPQSRGLRCGPGGCR